jgi:hypothetical protein
VNGERISCLDPRSIVSSATEIPFSRLDDDILAIDQNAGYCYSLNASAARVWDLILTPTSVGSICATLCGEFAVDHETCLRDVSDLLGVMREAGLVKVTDATMD